VRILLVGQAAFAEQVLEGLLTAGDEIVGIVCPPDQGTKPDPVKAAGLAHGIPVHQFASLKTPDAARAFGDAKADLAILAYVTQIVPEPLLRLPRLTSICFHPSLLPRYRGGSAINWQLIRGETETGVTVFWPDAGVDTGPILLQRRASVGPDDTAGTLYYQTLFPLGVSTVLDAVRLIREGRAPRLTQDESVASHDGLCRDAQAAIDWTRPSAIVHDLVRGCDPQPGAHTGWRGGRLRCYDSHRVAGDAGTTPGTVLAVTADGMVVATGEGSAIRCARLRGGGAKAAAAQVAAAEGVGSGSRID